MAVNSKKLDVKQLTPGMYISKLDRPWIETSYPIEGFYLQDLEEINQLSSFCRFVYIDIDLTRLRIDISHLNEELIENKSRLSITSLENEQQPSFEPIQNQDSLKLKVPKQKRTQYVEKIPFEKEFKTANVLYESITQTAEEVLNKVSSGKSFNIKQVNQTACTMVDSIIRNPDAFLWLSRLKAKDTYTHNRSIRATVWAIAFGRYLSFPKKELVELSMAVLLANIGKARLPKQLLEKSEELQGAEITVYQKHISNSVKLLTQMGPFSKKIIATIAAHCEHYDGSGYPRKLSNEQIIFPAQIAGLVSYYEKITNRRNSEQSLDATRAMEHLYTLRNKHFHGKLIEEFIQSIGIYPAGSLIELNSKEVAVIVEQNEQHRLLPRVMILRDSAKKPVKKLKILDLSSLKTKEGIYPKIINSIPLGSYDIHSDEIINSIQKADKSWLMKKLFS